MRLLNTNKLKRILILDDVFPLMIIFILSISAIYILIKSNPQVVSVIILDKKNSNNKQVITFSYVKNDKVMKGELVDTFDNDKQKEVVEVFSVNINKGDQALVEFDRITSKPIRFTYNYIDVSESGWTDYISFETLFVLIIVFAFIALYFSRKSKYKTILNGKIAIGSHQGTSISTDYDDSTSYVHKYRFRVNGTEYIAKHTSMSNVSYNTVQIIYNTNNPTKNVVFEHQSKRLRAFLFANEKTLVQNRNIR